MLLLPCLFGKCVKKMYEAEAIKIMRKISKNRSKKIYLSWQKYNQKMWVNCVTQTVHKYLFYGL
jgi:hypothetical protein